MQIKVIYMPPLCNSNSKISQHRTVQRRLRSHSSICSSQMRCSWVGSSLLVGLLPPTINIPCRSAAGNIHSQAAKSCLLDPLPRSPKQKGCELRGQTGTGMCGSPRTSSSNSQPRFYLGWIMHAAEVPHQAARILEHGGWDRGLNARDRLATQATQLLIPRFLHC